MRPWRSLGAFQMRQASTQIGYWSRWKGCAILVPALCSVEITNAVLMAERRKRVKQPEIRRFVELLDALTVIMDSQSVTER